jgi:hypothetical protein
VRGGATANVSRENMTIKKATLMATINSFYNIKLPEIIQARLFKNGKEYKAVPINGEIARIYLKKGDILDIEY